MIKLIKVSVESETAFPLIENAIEGEKERLSLSEKAVLKRLKEFEGKCGCSSTEFYQEFEKGEKGDSEEFMEWAGEYETLLKIRKDIEQLDEVKVCR